jgi:hypothetical protein
MFAGFQVLTSELTRGFQKKASTVFAIGVYMHLISFPFNNTNTCELEINDQSCPITRTTLANHTGCTTVVVCTCPAVGNNDDGIAARSMLISPTANFSVRLQI